MGKYPNFVVAEYCDVLQYVYGWSPEKIERLSGVAPKSASSRSLQRYPNDRQVLRLIRLLDELGYYREHDLVFSAQSSRSASKLQQPVTAIRLTVAELRHCESVPDFFSTAVTRFARISGSSRYWIEHNGQAIRLCHQYVHPEEQFCGPQRTFVFLLEHLADVMAVGTNQVRIRFARQGIRDEAGFVARTGCTFTCADEVSYIDIDESEIRHVNRSHNPLAKLAIQEALEDLLVAQAPTFQELVEQILTSNLESSRCSLDVETVARMMGLSRATLHRRLKSDGIAFKDLRSKVRFAHASRLLLDTALDINQISDILDYSEPSAFCRAFKSQSGCSPNEYRSRNATRAERVQADGTP